MQHETGVKYVPQILIGKDFESLYDWATKGPLSFDNEFEARGYLNKQGYLTTNTRILRIITEVV